VNQIRHAAGRDWARPGIWRGLERHRSARIGEVFYLMPEKKHTNLSGVGLRIFGKPILWLDQDLEKHKPQKFLEERITDYAQYIYRSDSQYKNRRSPAGNKANHVRSLRRGQQNSIGSNRKNLQGRKNKNKSFTSSGKHLFVSDRCKHDKCPQAPARQQGIQERMCRIPVFRGHRTGVYTVHT